MLTDQNLSSNTYFHIVNVNILFCLQNKWVRYSHCTNQGQTQPFKASFGGITLKDLFVQAWRYIIKQETAEIPDDLGREGCIY